jgi:hypothetical protein
MSNGVNAFLTFCEDVRVEGDNKPMMLGMLANSFSTAPNPGYPDHLFLVTLLQAEAGVERISLNLDVTVRTPGREDDVISFHRDLPRDEVISREEDWSAFIPARIDVPEWLDGSTITAELVAGTTTARTAIRCSIVVEEDDEENGETK